MEAHRGRGPDTQGENCGDNTGKVQYPAGTGDNLQRPIDEVSSRRRREAIGLAHESVGAKKEG
jgi:hypothetical protein